MEITNSFGCKSLSDPQYFETKRIKDGKDGGIKIYPNPVLDQLTIEFYFGPNVNIKAEVAVYDNLGRQVLTGSRQVDGNFTSKIQLNTFGLAPGMYYLYVNLNAFTAIEKIVKAR